MQKLRTMRNLSLRPPAAIVSIAMFLGAPGMHAQTASPTPSPSPVPAATSDYVFRFNTGVSGVFLNSMTFASEKPIDLGACTVNERINGPLACVINCQNQAVCLLELKGPSGSGVNEVLELVSETPATAGSALGASHPGSAPNDRIQAYNGR